MKKFLFITFLLLIISCGQVSNWETTNQAATWIQRALVLQADGTTAAQDILIKNGVIAAIKDNPKLELTSVSNPKIKVIDAQGQFTMPGFIDAHAHFISVGKNKTNLDLLRTQSWEEIVEMLRQKVAATPKREWIVGRGWHQEKWSSLPESTVEGFPVHQALSEVAPDHPVILTHASGHGLIANAKAMELAKVTAETPTPEGGVILKDESGQPTGIFQENAMDLIYQAHQVAEKNKSAAQKQKEWMNYLRLAEEESLSQGITTVHDASISFEDALKFRKLSEKGDLNVRIYAMLSDMALQNTPRLSLKEHIEATRNNRFFTNTAVKAFADGALGSRGAWLLKDYSDMPGYRGENVTPIESLEKTARIAKDLDVQVCIHAIGDRGNREVIDVFEKVAGDELSKRRWRIEHAQHLNPSDIDRIAELDIIASMQTIHATSDAPYAVKRLGEKRIEEGGYVWHTLLEKGVKVANGTDAPIERINPFENLYAAVTRKPLNSDEAFYPAQKMTRKQALEIYTQANAYAGFQEDWKGKIQKGYVADIVILDTNLLTCDASDIPTTQVLYTLVDGEVKYQAEKP